MAPGVLGRFFDHYYRQRPVNATFTGVHDHDGELPDWSPEGLEACADEMRALRGEIARGIEDSPLFQTSAEEGPGANERTAPFVPDRLDLALADAFLEIQLAELDSARFQRGNPALFTGEAIFGFLGLVTRDFAPLADRLGSAARRLRATPAFLAQGRRTLSGRTIPRSWILRALRECQGAGLLLGRGLDRLLGEAGAAPRAVAAELRAAARTADEGFREFARWLAEDVASDDSGRVGCGPELFDLLLRRGHWCRESSTDLLREARETLAAARVRLDEQAGRVDPGGWPGVQARLEADHPTAEDYLPTFERTWQACRRCAAAHDLVTWPDVPIRYVPIPAHTREAAPLLYYLFYRSPAPFDVLPVHDYVVTPVDETLAAGEQERRLRATNRSVIKLNHVVHHGAIGHHVQNFHAYRSRSRIGQVAAVDCASRIGMFLGGTLAEGWACYATDLMGEAGFLTPLELVAEQHGRVRQLARAVVDIELHRDTMDEESAVAFYVEMGAMTEGAARGEVTKNAMFPGAAIMYWLGTDGIHRLRVARARAEGAAFSLRRFHDALLAFGAIPVPLIAELMTGPASRPGQGARI